MRAFLFITAIVLAFFAYCPIAKSDQPRAEYTDVEQAAMMSVAGMVGALKYCEDHGMIKMPRSARLGYYKLADHLKPHVGEKTEMGQTAELAHIIFVTTSQTGRFIPVIYDGKQYLPMEAESIHMRLDTDCRRMDRGLTHVLTTTKLLDNDVTLPGEIAN